MPDAPPTPPLLPAPPPPGAFPQGVGTVFQIVGVTLFLINFFVCCTGNWLFNGNATLARLGSSGWGTSDGAKPIYSAQRAISLAAPVAVVAALAIAVAGLGLQARKPHSAPAATAITGLATLFYAVHGVFFATTVGSISLSTVCVLATLLFAALFALAVAAWRDMIRNPPADDDEDLSVDLSDLAPGEALTPELRMQLEISRLRQRQLVEQKELEQLERRLRRHQDEVNKQNAPRRQTPPPAE